MSFGFSFTSYTTTYNISGEPIYYKGTDVENHDYHQILRLKDGSEDLKFTIWNFPIMLRYKKKFGESLAGEIAAGPSLLSIGSQLKSINATEIRFEAIYQYDSISGNLFTGATYNQTYTPTINDWLITEDHINSETEINNLHQSGYNVGKAVSPSFNDISNRLGLAVNVTIDIFYHINQNTALKFGVSYIQQFSQFNHNNDDYMLASIKTTESSSTGKPTYSSEYTYDSVYNSNIKSNYSAFGINAGIIIGLNIKKKSK